MSSDLLVVALTILRQELHLFIFLLVELGGRMNSQISNVPIFHEHILPNYLNQLNIPDVDTNENFRRKTMRTLTATCSDLHRIQIHAYRVHLSTDTSG